ncbi:MAG: UDP-3-O-[3-hydroxymyristoyl] N-acetylglucosamine deacetylase, partial [Candidatus Omnitrophica bacterium]|nr:UDP-3-O-[3-hydroxymyristoyl] N-acetylglucosamine deacetylase [Candidatus Omnitrophota bacterium]
MDLKQRTIQREISLSGIGLHTGVKTSVTLKPAPENSGICFIRTDLPNRPAVKVTSANIIHDSKIPRCSALGCDGIMIYTVEHFLSVLSGLKISNLIVEISGEEMPGLDGSALEYLNAVKEAGIIEQNAPLSVFAVREPIGVQQGEASIYIFPADDFKVSYTLNYNDSFLKSQFITLTIDEHVYEKEIAPSRTFCLEREAAELQKNGLGKGANYQNTLVIGNDGVVENELRFADECARHKMLDLIGDLYILGQPIKGHIFAVKSGHYLNGQLLKNIEKQKERCEAVSVVSSFDETQGKTINIGEIMKILPHRYPFLLVDKVVKKE